MNMSLVEKTGKAIESVSKMETIRPYILVGGTALSLQIENRLSEDLDFMRWQSFKGETMSVDINNIKKELQNSHTINKVDVLDINHIEIYIDEGVKLSFYALEKRPPIIKTVPYLNNIVLADIGTIAALKLETMQRRNLFRDYYDLYCIFKDKSKEEIISTIDNALKYSQHNLRSKNLLGMLCNPERFSKEPEFEQLKPKYNISAKEISEFMKKNVEMVYRLNGIENA